MRRKIGKSKSTIEKIKRYFKRYKIKYRTSLWDDDRCLIFQVKGPKNTYACLDVYFKKSLVLLLHYNDNTSDVIHWNGKKVKEAILKIKDLKDGNSMRSKYKFFNGGTTDGYIKLYDDR